MVANKTAGGFCSPALLFKVRCGLLFLALNQDGVKNLIAESLIALPHDPIAQMGDAQIKCSP